MCAEAGLSTLAYREVMFEWWRWSSGKPLFRTPGQLGFESYRLHFSNSPFLLHLRSRKFDVFQKKKKSYV
ncbi:hypothetical protein LguiA_009350 [Lonicera macranthoides]